MNNILLVEDDYLDEINVQRAFNKANIPHVLTVARNGREALEVLEESGGNKRPLPDIILLDLSMPKMNGLEFLKRLRSTYDPRLRNIKVFITTTSNDEEEHQQAAALDVDGIIVKPIRLDTFDSGPSAIGNFSLLCDLLKN